MKYSSAAFLCALALSFHAAQAQDRDSAESSANQSAAEQTESSAEKRERGQRGPAAERRSRAAMEARNGAAMDRRRQANRGRFEVKDPKDKIVSDEAIFSGPQAGEPLLPISALGVRGERKEKEFDPIALVGDGPHILIFQDTAGVGLRGIFGLTRLLDQLDGKEVDGKKVSAPHLTAVFLGDDRNVVAQQTKGMVRLVSDGIVMGISTDGRDGPGSYGLNRNVTQTILIANQGKVVHNFVFPQGMLQPDPYVMGAIAEIMGLERDQLQTLIATTAGSPQRPGMQRPGMRRPDAKGPTAKGPGARRSPEQKSADE